jgi:hypothetical protein
MTYFVQRTRRSVALKRKALLFVLVPPLLYVFFRSLVPDEFRISRALPVRMDAPLAQMSPMSPARTAGDLVSHPEVLLEDQLGLMELNRHMGRLFQVGEGENFINAIRGHIQTHMTLEAVSDSAMAITYSGRDCRVGVALVNYYSQQLQRLLGGAVPKLQPDPVVEERRALWRPGELVTSLWILLASLAMILVIIVVLEWSDPSLKTVRQAGRYLDLPVLGVLPDLEKLDAVLKPNGGPNPR